MKRQLALFLLVVLLPSVSFSQETVRGRYCIASHDPQGITEARELARTLAIRDAIESWKGYREGVGPTTDLSLSGDIVQTISSGYLADLKVVEHTEEGGVVCETVEATISPEELREVVRREMLRRRKRMEETGVDSNGCLRILRTVRQSDRYGSRVMAVVKVLRPTGSLYLPSQRDSKPCFKVIVDSLDPGGLPLGSEALFVHDSEVGMSPGETRALYFPLHRDAKSFRAWLVGGITSPSKVSGGGSQGKRSGEGKAASGTVSAVRQERQTGRRSLRAVVPTESGDEVTMRILADGPVHRYRNFFMEAPSRLVIDLEGDWDLPNPSVTEVQGPLVMRIRTGNHPGKLRVVLDLRDGKRIPPAILTPSPEGLTVTLGGN